MSFILDALRKAVEENTREFNTSVAPKLIRRMNNLTACFLWRSKLPLGFPNDKTCIEQGIITSWQPRAEELRVAIIPNTLELETIWVSPKLWEEATAITHLRRHDALIPLPMDPAGNLQQEKLFPESVRGRRQSGGH